MKKYIKYFILVGLVFLLTGCYKMNNIMTINNDKSMDFEMIYALDTKLLNDLGETENLDDDSYDELLKKGYSVEEYHKKENSHDWNGVRIFKHFNNIDDITSNEPKEVVIIDGKNNGAENFDDSILFSLKDNVYSANLLFTLNDGNDSEEIYETEQIESFVDLVYIVNLPYPAISNNATNVSVDGKTLTWNLKVGKENHINYEFSFENNNYTPTNRDTTKDDNIDSKFSVHYDFKKILIVILIVILLIVLIVGRSKPDKK